MKTMKSFKSVEAYLADLPPEKRANMESIREAVKKQLTDLEELISYGIPAFKYHKRILIYYAAHTDHISIYPASDEMIEVVGEALAKHRTSKGTLQFKYGETIPGPLLKAIIDFRVTAIDKT